MRKDAIKKILSYQVPDKLVKVMANILLFCIGCLLFVCNAEAVAVARDNLDSFILWSNTSLFGLAIVTLAVLWGMIYCLVGNLFVSYIIMELISLCWGIANRIVLFTRNQFISIAEFKVLGEAAQSKINLQMVFHPLIIVLAVIGVIVGILFLLTRKMQSGQTALEKRRNTFGVRVVGMVVLFLVFIAIHIKQPQILLDNLVPYRETGNVVWFCQSLFNNVTKEVSYEEVQKIYKEFVELEQEEYVISDKHPNVIVIMSESFWDTNHLEGIVEASENPMDKYYEITKEAVTGQVAVNIFGGGTNHSEFEFLTGINARYLRSTDCYGEYFSREQGSLVGYMNELGYYTMALHPFDRTFYERDSGYSNMGFEVFYAEDDFRNKEMLYGYISDKSMTKEIIERFEEQKRICPQQPIFTFAVSVQNHIVDISRYEGEEDENSSMGITTNIQKGQIDKQTQADVEKYYNGLKVTIDALEELFVYFEDYEEDTVIVFFGDHSPSFMNLICDAENNSNKMQLYRTPYTIWTNYENNYESYGDINLSYLSSVLIEYLELPKPQQYYMNKYMLENYMINTKYEQEVSENLEEQKVLDMMNTVLYFCNKFPKEDMALPYWEIAVE